LWDSVPDDIVYRLECAADAVVSQEARAVRVLDLRSGAERVHIRLPSVRNEHDPSPMALAGDFVIVERTPQELSAVPIAGGPDAWHVHCSPTEEYSPVCDVRGVVVGGRWITTSGVGGETQLAALDVRSGAIQWRNAIDNQAPGRRQITSDGERVYVQSGWNLFAFDPSDGRNLWTTRVSNIEYFGLSAANGHVCGRTEDRQVDCFDAGTGAQLWSSRRFVRTSVIQVVGDVVYAGGSDDPSGYVAAVDVTTGSLRWVRRVAGTVTHLFVRGSTVAATDDDGTFVRMNASDGSVVDAVATSRGGAAALCGTTLVIGGEPIRESRYFTRTPFHRDVRVVVASDVAGEGSTAPWVTIRGRATYVSPPPYQSSYVAATTLCARVWHGRFEVRRDTDGIWVGAADGFARTAPDGSFVLHTHARGHVVLRLVARDSRMTGYATPSFFEGPGNASRLEVTFEDEPPPEG
jgi:outer membrane protein assembly factor BamB